MHLTRIKKLIWFSIAFVAVLITFLVNSFMRSIVPNATNARPMASADEEGHFYCDPIVIVVDDAGNIYLGKNRAGSLTDFLDLTTKLKEVIEKRNSLTLVTDGMDLNLEVPLPPCYEEPIYLKAGGDANLKALVRIVLESGVGPTQFKVIRDRKRARDSRS